MTPAEAMAAQPPVHTRPTWFFLPPAVHGWLTSEQRACYLPAELCAADELTAHDQLLEWDALAGKLLRQALFGDGDARETRQTAEAVAAVAERLSVALGASRA